MERRVLRLYRSQVVGGNVEASTLGKRGVGLLFTCRCICTCVYMGVLVVGETSR